MDEEILDKVEETRGIEEEETDHRINEFRDLVGRLDALERLISNGFDRLEGRIGAATSIAIDNGATPANVDAGEVANNYPADSGVDVDFLEKDWDELTDELSY